MKKTANNEKSTVLQRQINLPDERFELGSEGEYFGFIDSETGETLIPFLYDSAFGFLDGLAIVNKDGDWGMIDKSGAYVIPMKYQYMQYWHPTRIMFEYEDRYGLMDLHGNIIAPAAWDFIDTFSENVAAAELKGKCGYIDLDGNVVIDFIYDKTFFFTEGLARVAIGDKFGFINHDGQQVIPCIYDYVNTFRDGKARVGLRHVYVNGDYEPSDSLSLTDFDSLYFYRTLMDYFIIDTTGKVIQVLGHDEDEE